MLLDLNIAKVEHEIYYTRHNNIISIIIEIYRSCVLSKIDNLTAYCEINYNSRRRNEIISLIIHQEY